MGTRADFYVGYGKDAKWIGSVGWDGYEWAEDSDCNLVKATTQESFLSAVASIFEGRDDVSLPENGWPWPWDDSGLTDYAYYFDGNKVCWDDRYDWPDMSDIKNVQLGKKSGLIVVTKQGK